MGASSPLALRVLMTADAVGGVWTYALELARALGPHQVRIVLATLGPRPSSQQAAAASKLKNLTLLSRDLALEWMPERWGEVDAAGDWLLELERELCPDIVHINGYCHAALPFRAPVVSVAHSCVCSWWRAVHGADAPDDWNEYRRRVSAGLRSASVVVAPTAAILRDVAVCYQARVTGRVIHNGRRIDSVPVPKEEAVLSVGRLWDKAKNLQLLDASAGDLRWPVHVAGSLEGGHERTEIRAVQALGSLSQQEVLDRMSRAAVYCLPARYEPFGLSILEAAQAGCALVIGDIASLREVWGDAALFVPPDDPKVLSAVLAGLIAEPARRRLMSWRARRRASRYLPEPMALGYRVLYDELTQGPPNHRVWQPSTERILET